MQNAIPLQLKINPNTTLKYHLECGVRVSIMKKSKTWPWIYYLESSLKYYMNHLFFYFVVKVFFYVLICLLSN